MEFIRNIFRTFYSRDFYWKLIHQKNGIGIRYILFIAVLMLIPNLWINYPVWKGVAAGIKSIANSPLTMRLDKSGVSINQPMPFFIKAYDGNVVIDPSYKLKDMSDLQAYMDKNNINLFIMADRTAVRNQLRYEIISRELPAFKDDKPVVITHEKFVWLNEQVQRWFVPFVAGMEMIVILAPFLALAVAALILMLCSLVTGNRLHFTAGMRLAATSAIPGALLTFPECIGRIEPIYLAWLRILRNARRAA